ncbi:hypothetical protein JXB01_02540 [Candidatus Micrarchaeota archaeon]|nr:hypothetical protein [Candidatus Micrarchaeota archaeon]
MGMADFITYILKEFADSEVTKYKNMAEDEVQKLGDMMSSSIEMGMDNAMKKAVPAFMSAAITVFGVVFIAYGASKVLNVFLGYDGSGFVVVGVLAMLLAYFMRPKQ